MGPSPHPEMASFDISIVGVVNLLQEVVPFKAVGPDGIPLRLLKELSHELAPSFINSSK